MDVLPDDDGIPGILLSSADGARRWSNTEVTPARLTAETVSDAIVRIMAGYKTGKPIRVE